MASLTFYGATEGVTGSAYLIQTEKSCVLLECGLIQGRHNDELENYKPFPFDISRIDAVVLSHAHLDHTGRLPKLVAEGYKNTVYSTRPTAELLRVMLMDAAFLQMRDAEWENKRRKRAGQELVEPLYTDEDVETALHQIQGIAYGQREAVTDDIEICYRDAGHILGSAVVEIYISEQGHERKLVFSGDLGNSCAALLRDPEPIQDADMLMLESTYGNRDHRPMQETLQEFEDIILAASENGGNILIPAFAVGRTQEIIFHLGQLYQKGMLNHQAVFLDSPMAIAATEIYHRYQNVFNTEDRSALRQSESGTLHSYLPTLRYSRTTEESMAINRIEAGAIIIAGSGMCTGGRIRHHLKHNIWRRNAHVIIVGYQAMGTPGRALVDGAKTYRIGGEEIMVKAAIHTLGGFSAHASQSQLLDWCQQFKQPLPHVYLVHGEQDAKQTLRQHLIKAGFDTQIPRYNETVTI